MGEAPPIGSEGIAMPSVEGRPDSPFDGEAERACVGVVLSNPAALAELQEEGLTTDEDFGGGQQRAAWAAILNLSERQEAIDAITVAAEIERGPWVKSFRGGDVVVAIEQWSMLVPVYANAKKYAALVREKARRRRIIDLCQQTIRSAADPSNAVADILGQLASQTDQLSLGRSATDLTPLASLLPKHLELVSARYEKQGLVTGVATGLVRLDAATAGFQPGDYVIVAGRPSMGKSALAFQAATFAAKEGPVAVFSLEMPSTPVLDRMFANEARVDGNAVRTGVLTDVDFTKLVRALPLLQRRKFYIDDGGGQSVHDIREKCRRLKRKLGRLALVVIDYLQLIKTLKSDRRKDGSREQEVSDISSSLKALAKELGCPVVALSQLNRSLERREDKRPQMSDLRESGSLEQDADLICFIYRDEVYDQESADKGIAEIILGKQRNGWTGTVRVAFSRETVRFDNLPEDQPQQETQWG